MPKPDPKELARALGLPLDEAGHAALIERLGYAGHIPAEAVLPHLRAAVVAMFREFCRRSELPPDLARPVFVDLWQGGLIVCEPGAYLVNFGAIDLELWEKES